MAMAPSVKWGDASLANVGQPLLASVAEHDDIETPELLGREVREWAPYDNLDLFFTRLYRYWREKGFTVIVVTKTLSLVALAFTIAFSGFLILYVDWGALHSECIIKDECDVSEVAIFANPLRQGSALANSFKIIFLAIFSVYWAWTAAKFVLDLRQLREIWNFCKNKLGVSERQLATMTWPELIHRVVLLQSTTRLSIRRDLSEHNIVSRIMRKENYLIGMLNKGVLGLHVPISPLSRRPLLTTSVLWNLHWVLLDPMFDDRFYVHSAYLSNGAVLASRCKLLACVNLMLSPFLLGFASIHYFLSNAERFYHHPSSLGQRRWSLLAQWKMREFSELPHFVEHRLNSASEAASKYCAQFPSPLTAAIATFVAFVAAALAGVLIFAMLLNDMLVERALFGHTFVWWGAALGIVLAVARALTGEEGAAYDPEAAMLEVVKFTHWIPRHWRGRAHTREVQEEFQSLFQYQVVLWLEEVVSILLMPYILYVSLPASADDIANFLREFTAFEEGVGNICSLATFDLHRHGNARYGAPQGASKPMQTRQGKLEKSLVSFATCYPTWQPDVAASQFLDALHAPHDAGFKGSATASHVQPSSLHAADAHGAHAASSGTSSGGARDGDQSMISVAGSVMSGQWAYCNPTYSQPPRMHSMPRTPPPADNPSPLRRSRSGSSPPDGARQPPRSSGSPSHDERALAASDPLASAHDPWPAPPAVAPGEVELHTPRAGPSSDEGVWRGAAGAARSRSTVRESVSSYASARDAGSVYASLSAETERRGSEAGASGSMTSSNGVWSSLPLPPASGSHSAGAPHHSPLASSPLNFTRELQDMRRPDDAAAPAPTDAAERRQTAAPNSVPRPFASAEPSWERGRRLEDRSAGSSGARLAASEMLWRSHAGGRQAGALRAPLNRADVIALSMSHQTSGIFGGAEERVWAAHALLQHDYESRQPEHVQFIMRKAHRPPIGEK